MLVLLDELLMHTFTTKQTQTTCWVSDQLNTKSLQHKSYVCSVWGWFITPITKLECSFDALQHVFPDFKCSAIKTRLINGFIFTVYLVKSLVMNYIMMKSENEKSSYSSFKGWTLTWLCFTCFCQRALLQKGKLLFLKSPFYGSVFNEVLNIICDHSLFLWLLKVQLQTVKC